MNRMLLPAMALILASVTTAAHAVTIQSVLSCSSPNASVAINEQYSMGGSGYAFTTAAATLKDRFHNSAATVAVNSFGLAGTPSVLILTVDKSAIMIMIPRRTVLSFDQDRVKAKMIVDNGRSEEATCHVTPIGPKASE